MAWIPPLLWLWRRLGAIAPIRPLAWEPPYAAGAALEKVKRQKKEKKTLLLTTALIIKSHIKQVAELSFVLKC